MKRQVGKLDAVPSKRLFLSIIADYDLNKSICELVDNGFDVWTRAGQKGGINIGVWLDAEQGVIRVEDDAGGLPAAELRYIVGPGQSGSSTTDQTIGIFGVGTKRAVVALAEDITIRTRHRSGDTMQVEFDDGWLNDEDWELPLFEVDAIQPNTTEVELKRLRVKITDTAVENLRSHLGATYAKFLVRPGVSLKLNGIPTTPRFFNDWSFPPGYEPRCYTGKLETPKKRTVEVEVLAGLSSESSPTAGEYGVYFYCNDRLVAPAMKSFDVGFTRGQAGLPHPKISLTKVIVSLRGDANEMPWNSSKSDISTKHHVFAALHDWLVTVVGDYARISRTWMGQWPEKVFAHEEGDVVQVPIDDFITAKRSFLPDAPKSRPRLAERMATKNHRLAKRKPWVKGLYEGVVAATVVSKQPLEQANWFAFNLLDLTLTSALRAYLVNEREPGAKEKDLKSLLRRVPRVQAGLKEMIPLTDDLWAGIENMARRRDDLTYGRAEPTIADADLREAKVLTETILKKLHRIHLED
jgi:hypothetical protein